MTVTVLVAAPPSQETAYVVVVVRLPVVWLPPAEPVDVQLPGVTVQDIAIFGLQAIVAEAPLLMVQDAWPLQDMLTVGRAPTVTVTVSFAAPLSRQTSAVAHGRSDAP